MNTQFCKIGKQKLSFDNASVNALELKYRYYVEEAYNTRQIDAGLSDVLYFEANKIKKHIIRLKNHIAKQLSA